VTSKNTDSSLCLEEIRKSVIDWRQVTVLAAERDFQPFVVAHSNLNDPHLSHLDRAIRDIEFGADVIEIDLRCTKDGKLIMQHDDVLKLSDGGTLHADSCTLEEIRDAVRRGLIDPSLCDTEPGSVHAVLEYTRSAGKLVNADLKDERSIDQFLSVVRHLAMESSIIISGCEDDRARMVIERKPAVQVLLNEDIYKQGVPPPYPERELPGLFYRLRTIGCGAVNIHYKYCDQAFVDFFRKRYVAVAVWTVDDEEDMRSCADLGVSSITTNRVETLVKMMQR
jgi:glycerophosphoryl diester phosphodiesterase